MNVDLDPVQEPLSPRPSASERSIGQPCEEATSHWSATQYRALLEAVPDMMFRVSADGTYLDFVPAKGLDPYVSPGNFLGKKLGDVLPQDVAEAALDALGRALETGEAQTIEYRLQQHEAPGDFEARIVPIGASEALAVVRDVTLVRRAQAELERNRALILTAAASMATAAFVHHGDRLVYVNPAAAEITGYAQDELLGMNFLELVHDDDRELMTARSAARIAGRSVPTRYEFKLVRKDGEQRWVDCSIGTPVAFEGAQVIVGTAIDITEQKRNEELLRLAREKLDQRIDKMVHPTPPYSLTFREVTVLSLASDGARDTEIAAVLGVSHRTVETHMANILRKMNATSRTQACVTAQREGLIGLGIVS